ncbi:TetR/AcrR family transcriptional regulator [Pseudomonas sp. TNT2022 ID1044]|uniref:TetR/AcrR family transcriptional regulator n=1 Tax=Pseudomonas sp. TNT2022 ID1044 TaxID=2942636 RepID=UPI002362B61F|nr:TetR/AcrR family transcriptional regulator [Pseudomonas sp. TNT2022 ID1044]MDD1000032.1 TetR/AcrR family transcriptional regulator [Pseudomonas sp. TNT2022 ID1044]
MARPRTFDEAKILTAAVDAFWVRGYEGTSTRDLVQCTGLNQPSLYNAFGDKRSLYRRSLEHYLECSVRDRIRRLEALPDAGMAVTKFFAEVVGRTLNDPLHRGCLLVNSALEVKAEDTDLRQAVTDEIETIRGFFRDRLHAFHQQNEGAAKVDATQGANHLLSVLLGIRVLARLNPDPACVTDAVGIALNTLGLPPLVLSDIH